MFNCARCGKTTNPGEPCTSKMVLARRVRYPKRRVQYKKGQYRPEGRGGKPLQYWMDHGGEGFEAVKELMLCPDCAGIEIPVEEESIPLSVQIVNQIKTVVPKENSSLDDLDLSFLD